MKQYRGLEIKQVVELIDSILYSTDLTDKKNVYKSQIEEDQSMLTNDVLCLITDDEQSFLLASVDEDDCSITISMWAGVNNKINFKQMIEYINVLKGLLEPIAKQAEIIASFRTTTSLPIMKRLIKRYDMQINYIGEEEDGFCEMSICYNYMK